MPRGGDRKNDQSLNSDSDQSSLADAAKKMKVSRAAVAMAHTVRKNASRNRNQQYETSLHAPARCCMYQLYPPQAFGRGVRGRRRNLAAPAFLWP
jgi:hypothetical protein